MTISALSHSATGRPLYSLSVSSLSLFSLSVLSETALEQPPSQASTPDKEYEIILGSLRFGKDMSFGSSSTPDAGI